MPSLFRNVIRSRRKKKKNRSSTTPVNFNETVLASKPSDMDRSTSSQHDPDYYYATKKPQHQNQFLRVLPDGNTEPNDSHPNRHRSRSFESYDIPNSNSKDSGHGRKNLFKSLRRKSKHGPMTPDTVASGGGDYTPPSSEHDRTRREGYPHRSRSFDESPARVPESQNENYEPYSNSQLANHNNSHDRQRRKLKQQQGGEHHQTNSGSNTQYASTATNKRIFRVASSGDDKPPSWRGTGTKPVKLRFQQNDNRDDHQATTTKGIKLDVGMGKRSSGNTKTVIMNGDIVLSSSYNSRSSCDTATITSASSLSKAKRRETERNARAAAALDEKANELFERGYFDKAMACYTKALKLKRRTFAHLLEETDDMDGELELRDDCGNRADPDALVSMATSINNIGYLRQRSGDATPEETMAAYKKSLRIKRRILGNDSLSVGKTLNNVGSVHYLKRDLDKALSAYLEALEIMKANLGEKHPDVATVMSNIGDVYLAQGDKDTSIKYYRLALAIRWEAFGEKSPRTIRLLEKISNLEIGDMSSKMANQIANGDDVASESMVGSDFHSVSEALRLLQEQVKSDIARLDQMERDATMETFKDKIILIRGMRDVWNGSGPELLDNDSESVQTAMSRLSSR